MARLRYNGVYADVSGTKTHLALGASLTNSATSVTFNGALKHAGGTAVPTIAAPDFMPITVLDAAGVVVDAFNVTAYTAAATTATVVRNIEGFTGVAHSSGALLVHGGTAADAIGQDARFAVGTAETSIDEFDGAAIDSSWVRVDVSGGSSRATWTHDRGVMSGGLTGTADAAGELHAIMRPIASMATGDALVTRLSLVARVATSNVVAGLILADGVVTGSGAQITTMQYTNDAHWAFSNDIWSKNGYHTVDNSAAGIIANTAPNWARLAKTGSSTWRHDISPDGVSWIPAGSLSKTVTPTHAGFYISNWGSSQVGVAAFDFLRRVSGIS